ncbi:conjugal transfer protein TraF [Ruegeria jejuensis]|uniref:conjugal transfer protein TraF n=1 Tax=Ruegeria jejuensis TaxID=3233338 RepID=UPI00355C8297
MKRRVFLSAAVASLIAGTAAFAEAPKTEVPGIGVILIGASWCSLCHSAAPVLAAIVDGAAIPVLVASQDGRPIAPFPDVVDASEHPVAAAVQQFPTTLIYSHAAGRIVSEIVGYKNARQYAQRVSNAILAAAQEVH